MIDLTNYLDYTYLNAPNVTKDNLPTLKEGYLAIEGLVGQRLVNNEKPNNKGGLGISLEKTLGLPQGSHQCDFADGELKTAKLNPKKTGLKDDFRLSAKWDIKYIIEKVSNMIVVTITQDDIIDNVYHLNMFDNPKVMDVLLREFNFIMEKGLDKISQSDTNFFVAKTQNHSRSLYIARPFMSVLLGYEFSGRKGYETYKEVFC